MTTTITAAVVRSVKAPFTIEQLQLDDVRPNEARIRLVAAGVCHTDAIVRTASIRHHCQQYWDTRERG